MTATPTDAPYGDRLRAAMDALGPFCPGIDPHAALLEQWGLPDTVAGLETFALTCVEAFGGAVAAVKPQSAFFERFGSRRRGGARAHPRRPAGRRHPLAARRQARRHRLDDGRLRLRPTSPTARRCGPTRSP